MVRLLRPLDRRSGRIARLRARRRQASSAGNTPSRRSTRAPCRARALADSPGRLRHSRTIAAAPRPRSYDGNPAPAAGARSGREFRTRVKKLHQSSTEAVHRYRRCPGVADQRRVRAAVDAGAPAGVEVAAELGAHAGRERHPAGLVELRVANEKDTALRVDIGERQPQSSPRRRPGCKAAGLPGAERPGAMVGRARHQPRDVAQESDDLLALDDAGSGSG